MEETFERFFMYKNFSEILKVAFFERKIFAKREMATRNTKKNF